MPYRVAMILYPLVSIAIVVAKPGPVGKLAKAKAFSPEMARRPESLEIKNAAITMENPIRSGLIVPTGDGRFYVDLKKYRRRKISLIATLAIVGVALGAGLLLLETRAPI